MRKLHPKLRRNLFFAGLPGLCFPRKWHRCAPRPRRDAPKKVPTKPGNCTAEYTIRRKCIDERRHSTDWWEFRLGISEDGLKMHDVVPTLYQRSVRCSLAQLGSQSNEPGTNKDHPIEVPPSSPATRPPFLQQWAGHRTNQHLWWSCWLPWRQQEPVSAADCCTGNLPRPKDIPKLSATIKSFGLLKAC